MILIAIAALTLLILWNVNYLRRMTTRSIRWKLYDLRDRLRWEAIEDRALLKSPLFWLLDERLSRDCAHLDDLTLWNLLPFIDASQQRKEEIAKARAWVDAELLRPENAKIAHIYKESSGAVHMHLVVRHIWLILLALVTILGPFVILKRFKVLANRLTFDPVAWFKYLPARGRIRA